MPSRSLLSRITDHYLQIIANQAPIGFEAEFVNQRGATILYRGILLPFSSDNDTIDYIYGVINWKELADQATADELLLQIDQALESGRRAPDEALELTDWIEGPLDEIAPLVLDSPLDEGIGALQPMTMDEVATATGVNQSTVSRAVAGTAVDTPRGTWWLRELFSQAIRWKGPAAASLREALARMVAAEDPAHPLSDAMLAAALAGAGAPVARRTVAKYRGMLGIPPAQRRQKRDRKGRGQG